MNSKIIKRISLATITSIFMVLVINFNIVKADTQTGNVRILPLNGATDEGIFNYKDGLWYPGRSEVRDFYIENNNDDVLEVEKFNVELVSLVNSVSKQNIEQNSDIYNNYFKNSTIAIYLDGKLIKENSFLDILKTGGIAIDENIIINGKSKKNMQLGFSISRDGENDLQDLVNKFNLGITYKIDDSAPITVMPQTGSRLSMTTLISFGVMFIGIGIFLVIFGTKKKLKIEGGHQDD